MDADLERVYNLVTQAVRAEDIFGTLVTGDGHAQHEVLETRYAELTKVADPDFYSSPDDKELAFDAKQALSHFYERAKERLAEGLYGARDHMRFAKHSSKPTFTTDKRSYFLGDTLAQGTISTVYDGECAQQDEFAGRVAVKIVDQAADNELIWHERQALKMMHEKNGAQRKHLPVLLDHFKTEDDRIGLVFRCLVGCCDLWTVRESPQLRSGVDRKHMVWILNRLLSAIGYAHSMGIVHGNIEPAHLFIRPKDHNLFIVDWCWSVVDPRHTRDHFKICTEHFSAPEVQEKGEPTPAADLYSVGKCMIYLLGGDVETDSMPDSVEPELQRFLRYFVMESPMQRAQDAWQLHGQLESLVVQLWGQKRFLALPVKPELLI